MEFFNAASGNPILVMAKTAAEAFRYVKQLMDQRLFLLIVGQGVVLFR